VRVLVLDSQYQPLEILSWEKAISLVVTNRAEVLEEYDQVVRSPSIELKIPSVIRKTRARFRRRNVSFTRRNVFARDNYECQYCGKKKLYHDLTFDHIIPVMQKGDTSWENIVACCKPCNSKKADNTPEQAKMALRKKPEKPDWIVIFKLKMVETDPESWLYYIDRPK
jgi:5-methylcytosine-specific restriction endonuclease McrA